MIEELQVVALTRDMPDHGLKAGDIGTVVMDFEGKGYMVEFVARDGATIALVTLEAADIRSVTEGEIANARQVA